MPRNPKKKVPKRIKASKKNAGSSTIARPMKVWRPGVDGIEEDEELQFDPSAYDCLHAFHFGWPCLSFDIVRDALGVTRNAFPHTIFCVAATQADVATSNAIIMGRLSNITGKRRKKPIPSSNAMDEESESESESEGSGDEGEEGLGDNEGSMTPNLQVRMVAHQGCVNRIRAMQQQPHILATWGDNGYVQIWDMGAHLRSLSTGDPNISTGLQSVLRQAPLQIFTGHKDEGFAMDWSPVTPGRLVTGDCKNSIHLWEPASGSKWVIDQASYKGHTASVEDLQWSPTEAEVFASCSVDGTIGIWDARCRDKQVISTKAHEADVNVISWNRLASCMIASGCDDGSFRIWDLRSFKEDSFIAHFKYHRAPITSIEWSPHEASTVAASSSDNLLTIWDLSLERDEEEESEFQAKLKQKVQAPDDLPPQLLFVHQGQKDLKELHWHSQIPGLLVSTAADGFNVFRPSNMDNLPGA